jgi:hypothetical protein
MLLQCGKRHSKNRKFLHWIGEGGGYALPGKAATGTYQGICGNPDQCFPRVAVANARSALDVPILGPVNKEAECCVVVVVVGFYGWESPSLRVHFVALKYELIIKMTVNKRQMRGEE